MSIDTGDNRNSCPSTEPMQALVKSANGDDNSANSCSDAMRSALGQADTRPFHLSNASTAQCATYKVAFESVRPALRNGEIEAGLEGCVPPPQSLPVLRFPEAPEG